MRDVDFHLSDAHPANITAEELRPGGVAPRLRHDARHLGAECDDELRVRELSSRSIQGSDFSPTSSNFLRSKPTGGVPPSRVYFSRWPSISAYPSARFGVMNGERDVPMADNLGPFEPERYYDGERVTVPGGEVRAFTSIFCPQGHSMGNARSFGPVTFAVILSIVVLYLRSFGGHGSLP